MTKYNVLFVATASTVTTVDADSLAEAREIADDTFESPSLCAQCSGWGNDQNLELSDFEADESANGAWEA